MKGVIIKKIEPVHSDERGMITDILNENLGHVGLITTKKDTIRGNHYHLKSIQYSYILDGKLVVLLADSKKIDEVEKVILNAGELIIISPGIVHSFKGLQDSTMIDMISQSREGNLYEEDVIKSIFLKES